MACHGSVHVSPPPTAARHNNRPASTNLRETELTHDELRKLERTRRRAFWEIARLLPGDPKAADALAILDDLDNQERSGTPSMGESLELNEVRASVPVQHHNCGIDIVLEITIPQPWRERFQQASIGSTRVVEGPYATDWDKFLARWEAEMRHLEQHRAVRNKPVID
ncbi:hypothetical protein D3C76_161180 [compost metagenome]